MAENSAGTFQFVPFNSFLDGGFWHKLAYKKLNVYALDDSVKSIQASYYNGDPPGMPCRMSLDHTAFDEDTKPPTRCFRARGSLFNTNTLDGFKEIDKKTILDKIGTEIWESVTSGQAVEDPSLLSRFLLLTFSDLKKYHFYYWFAFPCLCPAEDFSLLKKPRILSDVYSQAQISQLVENYNTFQASLTESVGYFIIIQDGDQLFIDKVCNTQKHIDNGTKVVFGFADPSTMESHPGWPLRNYLALISHHWGARLGDVEVVCFRYLSRSGVHDINHSLLLNVKISSMADTSACPKCVGWEKNERQKLGPRLVNLSSSMDPVRLSESAVDLNLKLMRWRLLPNLDLDTVSQTKCLLLGAGTLGCNVARCLLGWGVRNITLVDNGRVSYSNPVRQTLFVFDDCKKTAGGCLKAEAAAESLKKIFPGVNSEGVSLSIPMPGHAVSESAIKQTREDVERLDALVASHDAIFLLLDTRESRWLPTVMAAAKKKIVICSALGFDTFLVMRHGYQSYDQPETSQQKAPLSKIIPGNHLGCYFCNDVVAPGNSTRDRTLDQQCTVSRPGMSYIASALAVELLVSVLQHPDRGCAPGDTGQGDDFLDADSCPLGLVPHQLRGFLSRFQQIMPASRAFDKCTACSKMVVEQYKSSGFDFLLNAFNEPNFLEDLTGLTQMHQETADAEVWDYDDEEEFSSMDSS
ncbi:ubiquitin-like modifier-activating enzyme ATG7 [Mercenaria mercenaria]|uniref:ubiquitin-like modifier-activating enzyme ATG7 n=1 Tax=Mercenaria mercenaria TaxID=6596 RepID=UPI00234F4875|nr:ubiquitin-like modifier-activating enzyme ATG7 [Mercenaria mercenaria]XP_045165106.2 ubiquitin-like modifier-activating enzyme ATG7 [Mercenaria mercenaria]XP_045165108.2 ubiquitin-like modifier-activating enzyme ATG7 [Mercenaria mercenaria]XP_045165109.2 ubiquitin-like modifier-activating enzyme ATG7 [Mercenaria mercenaria]XP_045165111.2 ubiquitin-like modifier-activating enzyme ATG7 [Mercenaria mercenaria]